MGRLLKILRCDLNLFSQENPYLAVVFGDFNAKSHNWCNTAQKMKSSVNVTRSADSITDFVFTSLPNMVLHSGFHSSFYLNSHYQIAFAKFNLKLYYPPPLGRQVWRCKYANTVHIKNALASFNFL